MKGFFNHLNPAVIKSSMLKMNEQEFLDCFEFIKAQAMELPNSSKRVMYVNLYHWCQLLYQKRFKKNKPSLF